MGQIELMFIYIKSYHVPEMWKCGGKYMPYCENCRLDFSSNFCPNCGQGVEQLQPVKQPSKKSRKPVGTLGKVCLGVVVFVIIISTLVILEVIPSVFFEEQESEWDGVDTDGDNIPDDEDNDDDNDGFLDEWEEFLGTDPYHPNDKPTDTDGDGKPDGDRINSQLWMDTDDDNDTLSDADELAQGTDPLLKDTDGDGHDDDLDEFPLNKVEWQDSDNDGLGDNVDLNDTMNVGLCVAITYFKGDPWIDGGLSAGDPCFEIDIWNGYDKSREFQNNNEITNPFTFTYDIPDDDATIRIKIGVRDEDDFDEYDVYDIDGDSAEERRLDFYFDWTSTSSETQYYTNDGKFDGLTGDFDAYIEYEVSIIEIMG